MIKSSSHSYYVVPPKTIGTKHISSNQRQHPSRSWMISQLWPWEAPTETFWAHGRALAKAWPCHKGCFGTVRCWQRKDISWVNDQKFSVITQNWLKNNSVCESYLYFSFISFFFFWTSAQYFTKNNIIDQVLWILWISILSTSTTSGNLSGWSSILLSKYRFESDVPLRV